ncbi:MAG: hypothetical protein RL637_1786 [Pseudomonadota bacterium]|jgi:hypothetical protein
MRIHYYLSSGAWLLTSVIFNPIAFAKSVALPDQFPIPMAFKAVQKVDDKKEMIKRIEAHEPFPVIQVNAFDLQQANPVSKRLRDRWPDKLLIVQRAYGGVGAEHTDVIWPGHLLYKTGTLLTQDINPNDTQISVKELHRLINDKQADKLLTQSEGKYALTIYALNAAGKPDWSQAEHVVLQSVNKDSAVIQRGQWGTKPLAFKAGKAVVAAHMMFWSGQWQVNFSLHCPRGGKENLTGAEWYAREMAKVVQQTRANGIQFDVGRWIWGAPKNNHMDANNDLIPDYGYIEGVNSFGLGGQVFFKELRRVVGPDIFIQTDSNDAIGGVRGWNYLNGVQLESFPATNDFERFSTAFNHLRSWTENVQSSPKFSYPFTKVPTSTYAQAYAPDGSSTDFRFRLGLAAASMVGMPHPFAQANEAKLASDVNHGKVKLRADLFPWDEYHGGDLNDWKWLGKALAPAQQELGDLDKTNLLAKTEWQWVMDKDFVADAQQTAEGASVNVQAIPAGIFPEKMWFGVSLLPKNPVPLVANTEYTLEFDARGGDFWHYAGQDFDHMPRALMINGAVTTANTKAPLSLLIDSEWRTYRLSFVADGSTNATPIFGVSEQIGSTEIRNIKLYQGGAERWSREFEKGVVLLNGTHRSWTVSLAKNKYRYLKGSQNPTLNNGQAIDSQVTVPAMDALFLVKRQP